MHLELSSLSTAQLADVARQFGLPDIFNLAYILDGTWSGDGRALLSTLIDFRGRLSSERALCSARTRNAERVMVGGGLSALLSGIALLVTLETPLVAFAPMLGGLYVAWRGYIEALNQVIRGSYCDRIIYVLDRLLEKAEWK